MTLLETVGLSKSYGTHVALRKVSMKARGGSIVGVIGPSGSGKTTLVRHLHLLEAPDGGKVRIDGAVPPYAGRDWLRTLRRFAMVQQRPGLLRTSALDNVAFPLVGRGRPKESARSEALTWLGRLGLGKRLDAHPHELSGGEAQRVALARALCTRPDVLLIDEGTNQLDPHWVRAAETLLRAEAARGCLIILVTHNVPQTLRLADSFIFLENGRIVESGNRARLRDPRRKALRDFLETGF